MQTIIKTKVFTFLCICITFLSSCDKDDSTNKYIQPDKWTIEFPSNGGTENLHIDSNCSWYIITETYINDKVSGLSLLTVSPKSGTGEKNVNLYMEPNKFIYDINIDLTLYIEGNYVVVHVFQQKNPNGIDENGNSTNGNDNQGGNTSSLTTPSGVSAKANGSTVTISWNAVNGASKYKIYRSSSPSSGYSLISTVSQTNATDNNPLNGYNYYKVAAVNGSQESNLSSYASVNISKDSSSSSKPSTPTGLRAVQEGQTIIVSWNSVPNTYYYRLYYKTPSGDENFTNVYAPNTSAVFSNYMKNGTYTFWIQAVNSNYDASTSSNKITCNFSTNNGGGNEGNTQKQLDTPKNLEAFGQTGWSFVQISFDEVTLAYSYELYRSKSAYGSYTKITATGGSTSGGRYILTDQNPLTGTSYYKVKAIALSYLNIEDSDLSNYVSVTR